MIAAMRRTQRSAGGESDFASVQTGDVPTSRHSKGVQGSDFTEYKEGGLRCGRARIEPGSKLGQLAVLVGSCQEIERSLLNVFDSAFVPSPLFY